MVLVLMRFDFLPGQLPRGDHRRAHHSALAVVRLHRAACPRRAANLLSIGAIDFGIIIDGTVVMVENIYRELALREGQEYKLNEVILAAAKDVDRPIFYSVAVILAGIFPIYALSGPSGKLFHPMAETMSFALIGSLILTLRWSPSWLPTGSGKGCARNRIAPTNG